MMTSPRPSTNQPKNGTAVYRPPHYGTGGGHGFYGMQQHQQQQQHETQDRLHYPLQPQHAQRQQPIGSQIMAREEIDFSQMIAQKMLTAKAPSSPYDDKSRGRTRRDDAHEGAGIHPGVAPPEPQPVPPWEANPAAPARRVAPDESQLPVLQLHNAYQALHPAVDIQSYTSNDVTDESNETATADNKSNAAATNPASNNNDDAQPPANTPKYVTFGTHDRIHQWDEQLDVLKNVDEEFFGVAHFLIDVVGVSNSDIDDFRLSDEEKDGKNQRRRGGAGGGVLGLLFGCGVGREADDGLGAVDSFGSGGSGQDGDAGRAPRQYRLTEKLVRDFVAAMKFRVENIKSNASSDSEEEGSDVAKRTREIVRKVNAYGLPLLPPSARVAISLDESEDPSSQREDGSDKEEEEEEEDDDDDEEFLNTFSLGKNPKQQEKEEEDDDDEEFLDTFRLGKKNKQQFFPILPINTDDDEDDGGSDENDQSLLNLQPLRVHNKPHATKEEPPKQTQATTFQLLTPTSICTSFLRHGSSSATPSEEDCRRRLYQIRREIEKAQKMVDATQNESVQAACRKRIERLKVERRFYQIVQERHKVQAMMETTEVPYVRKACKERFKQLINELGALELEEEEEEEEEAEEVVVSEKASSAEEEKSQAVCESVCGSKDSKSKPDVQKSVGKSVKSEGVQVGEDKSVRSEGVQVGEDKSVRSEGVQVGSEDFPAQTYNLDKPAEVDDKPAEDVDKRAEDVAISTKLTCGEDGHWYQQVFKYVTGDPSSQEEISIAKGTSDHFCGMAAKDRQVPQKIGYDPEHWGKEQQSWGRNNRTPDQDQQHGSKSQVRFSESLDYNRYSPPPRGAERNHDRYGDNDPRSVSSPPPPQCSERNDRYSDDDPRSVGSPPSDEAVYYDNFPYPRGQSQQQRRRTPDARHPTPVASAVNLSTSWFDDIKNEVNDLFS